MLLYNCENWFLANTLLHKLEAFQAEIGRRIFKLPKHHSERAVRLALEWPSMATRILLRKLQKTLSNNDSTAYSFLETLTHDTCDIPLKTVESCEFLEGVIGHMGITKRILQGDLLGDEKNLLLGKDRSDLFEDCHGHSSTTLAAKIANERSWPQLWDRALDYEPKGTNILQSVFRWMTKPVLNFGDSPCCLCTITDLSSPYFITCHSPFGSCEEIHALLTDASLDLSDLSFFTTFQLYYINFLFLFCICPMGLNLH